MRKMQVKRQEDKAIIELDLWQNSYDAVGELIGKVPNIIGVIAGDEYSISHNIDLGYKDDQQIGMPIIMFDTEEELKDACRELDLLVHEYPVCHNCGQVLYGCHGFDKYGEVCDKCHDENN